MYVRRRLVLLYALCTPLIAVAGAQPATAALVSLDYLSPGDGLLTWDTSTNLRWLDLSRSEGLSPRRVNELLRTQGSDLHGFRLASQAEVDQLMANAGIPYRELIGFRTENAAGVRLLQAMVGVTSMTPLRPGSQEAPVAGVRFRSSGYFRRVTPFGPDIGSLDLETWWDGDHWPYPFPFSEGILIGSAEVLGTGGGALPDVGHWLIAVPEPSSLGLLAAAGLALVLFRRVPTAFGRGPARATRDGSRVPSTLRLRERTGQSRRATGIPCGIRTRARSSG